MAANTQEGPFLMLLVEPMSKNRFRYESEKGSHGVLNGKEGKKSFPTVKLENYHEKKAVVVKASLYTTDKTLHVLELVGKNCKDGTCIQSLDKNNIAQFSTLSILNKKKEDVINILMNRKLPKQLTEKERRKLFNKFKKEVIDKSKEINLSSACLCFEAYYADDTQFTKPLCEKIFTERIDNQKSTNLGDLRICRISKSSGSCGGGEDMILLCEKVKKEDIKVRFYEVDELGNIIWEDFGEFKKADVHYQVAIPFRTPKYKENVGKIVLIQLVRISNGDMSEGVPFEYIPNENDIDAVSRKRKKCTPPQEINDVHASVDPLISPCYVNNTSCLSTYDQNFCPNSQESGTASVNMSSEYYINDYCLNGIDIDNLFNTGLQDSSSSSSHDIFNDAIINHSIDGLSESCSNLLNSDSFNNFESQMELVNTDGISYQMQKLKIIPEPSQKADNSSESIVKKEEIKKYINTFLKDLNMLHHYICCLISQAEKRNNDGLSQEKLNVIQKLLEIAPIVNKQNKFKETLLHVSTHHNNPDVLEILLKYGGDPNLRNKNGDNCLHIATRNNSLKCLEILFSVCSSAGEKFLPNVDVLNYEGLAPLHIALENESEECITLLLENGANINIKEAKSGRTVLHLAVDSYPCLVPIILKQPGILISAIDFSGMTPLDIAVHNELHDIEKRLLRASADERHENVKQPELYSLIENGPLILSDKHPKNSPPLAIESDTFLENDTFYDEETIIDKNCDEQFLTPSVVKTICELIDPPNDRWTILGLTMGLNENDLNAVEKLDSNTSPTRTLLIHLQRNFRSKPRSAFMQKLQGMLEVVGIEDKVLLS